MPQIYRKHGRNITSSSFVDNGKKRLGDCNGTTELSEVASVCVLQRRQMLPWGYASPGQIYFSRIFFPMQSDEPITLSDSAFYSHRDMRRDVFLFIRKITYQWIFTRSANKSDRIINYHKIKYYRVIFVQSASFSEISKPEIPFAINICGKTNE